MLSSLKGLGSVAKSIFKTVTVQSVAVLLKPSVQRSLSHATCGLRLSLRKFSSGRSHDLDFPFPTLISKVGGFVRKQNQETHALIC